MGKFRRQSFTLSPVQTGRPQQEERSTDGNRGTGQVHGFRSGRLTINLQEMEDFQLNMESPDLSSGEMERLQRLQRAWPHLDRGLFYRYVRTQMDPNNWEITRQFHRLQQKMDQLERIIERFFQRNPGAAASFPAIPLIQMIAVLRFIIDILEGLAQMISTYFVMSAELGLAIERIRDARDKSAALERELREIGSVGWQIASELLQGYINSLWDPLRKMKDALLSGNVYRLIREATRLATAIIELYLAYKSISQRVSRTLASRRAGGRRPGRSRVSDNDQPHNEGAPVRRSRRSHFILTQTQSNILGKVLGKDFGAGSSDPIAREILKRLKSHWDYAWGSGRSDQSRALQSALMLPRNRRNRELRRIFNNHRNRWVTSIYNDYGLQELFREAGIYQQRGRMPYLKLSEPNGTVQRVRLNVDHKQRLVDRPDLILDSNNLRLITARENSVSLEGLRRLGPFWEHADSQSKQSIIERLAESNRPDFDQQIRDLEAMGLEY